MSRRGYYDNGPNWLVIGVIAALLLLVVGIGGCATSYYKDSPVTLTIQDKNIVPTGSGSSAGHDYRINANLKDGGNETFVIEDSIIKGQLNTGDIYFRLHEGRTYNCKAYGWRIPLFSSFRAIHDCKDVTGALGK